MSSLATVTLCTINMYTYVSDVGACIRYSVIPVSSCRCVLLAVMCLLFDFVHHVFRLQFLLLVFHNVMETNSRLTFTVGSDIISHYDLHIGFIGPDKWKMSRTLHCESFYDFSSTRSVVERLINDLLVSGPISV